MLIRDPLEPSSTLIFHTDEEDELSMTELERSLQREQNVLKRKYMEKTKQVHDTRKIFFRQLHGEGRFYFFALIILLCLGVGNVSWYYGRSLQYSFFAQQLAFSLDAPGNIFDYFGTTRNTETKVVVCVLGGLGTDSLQNPELQTLLQSPNFKENSKTYNLDAQLPPHQLPNWVTLLTVRAQKNTSYCIQGATPEIHGQLGDDEYAEVTIDSVFQQAEVFNLKRALVADQVWNKLIYYSIEPLQGTIFSCIRYNRLQEMGL